MSRSEQETARRLLKSLKLMEERRMGVPAKLHYKVNLGELGKLLESQYQLAGSCQLDGEIAPSGRQSSASKGAEMRPANSETNSKNIKTNLAAPKNGDSKSLGESSHSNKSQRWIPLEALLKANIDEQIAKDWIALRGAKNAPVTETVLEQIKAEAQKAGITLQQAMLRCCLLGFAGFTADMVKQSKPDQMNESWQNSEKALLAKAQELGIVRRDGEITFSLKERVQDAIRNTEKPHKNQDSPPDAKASDGNIQLHESRTAFKASFSRLKKSR